MTAKRRLGHIAAAGALVTALAVPLLTSTHAQAEASFEALPQSAMSIVDVDSVESTGEVANGAAELVLDGSADTYWHTKWQGGTDPLPHHITIKLADAPVDLARVRLLPRQSSNGSGRVHEYELWTSANTSCADDSFTKAAEGEFDGLLVNKAVERNIVLNAPVSAVCAKVVYLSSWGGAATGDTSPNEVVASLAEFNADIVKAGSASQSATSSASSSEPAGPQPIDIVVPQGAVELVDGDLKVRLHPAFPQVVDYRLGDAQLAGRLGAPLTSVLINEVEQPVTVGAPVKAADGHSATYRLTFPNLAGVSMDAVASIADETFTLKFTNLVDPNKDVNRLRIPNHNLVTVGSADAASQLTAGLMNVNRTTSGDRYENVAATAAGNVQGSWMVMANNSTLAAAFDNNATEDNMGPDSTKGRVGSGNNRWQRQITADGATKYGTVWSGTWTWLGAAVENIAGSTIGRDDDPYVSVKITADRNADAKVDWQDAAVAARDIIDFGNGVDDVKNDVIARIPFNIVSQATHPFLRTLDDTKKISLATDNLGQRALLKGYQAEGHDAAHPDYAGHYNERAGGLGELKTLVNEGVNWNTKFGVHVNATESYSEAHAFSEELLRMPPQKAWGWMNQSYYINGPKDLATAAVLNRFQQFRDEVPENLDWLYLDVYYPSGWEAERLGAELRAQGWVIGSEWSDKLPLQSIWSHWSQEESYGGTTNKGINSDVIRFVYNSKRDTWNPHPILSNSNIVEYEGWTGHNDYNAFIRNVWERNLPVKFLQQSDIVKWANKTVTFANGTVATSPLDSIGGTTIPTNRTITFDGSTVFEGGKYLLPWTDGGTARLYHWNPAGGSSTWQLTDAWAAQSSLALFKLTDTGRVKVSDLSVSNGSVTIPGTESGVAYVLYPTSEVPAARTPQWGQGSQLVDPGFFSGTLDAYATTGVATIVKNNRGNYQAQLGAGASSIAQDVNLPAGTYSAWAWVEVEPGQSRPVTVGVQGSGVKLAGYGTSPEAGKVTNTITASTVQNSTASDELRDTHAQRVRVTFSTTGGPVKFSVNASAGAARVTIDDLRVVTWSAPVDPAPTDSTVYFQDFEHVDTGYFPFVTGATNRGGDARTQLAERHEPYSQKGWWGVSDKNVVEQGAKYNDNVLRGTWSLMANNENSGEILKTSPGAIPFQAGHKYRVSFDYQTTYADQYRLRLGHDVQTAQGVRAVNAVNEVLAQQRETARFSAELNVGACGIPFIAVDKLSGPNTQHNLTIDDLRVEDLGAADATACLDGAIVVKGGAQAGSTVEVTTTVSAYDEAGAVDVKHELVVPSGWTATVKTPGATTLAFGETSTQVWTVTVPANGETSTLTFTGKGTVNGQEASFIRTAELKVTPPLPAGEIYLSDMRDRIVGEPTNGWGPMEWDISNGPQGAGDGGPIKIDGITYPKGVGMHAPASATWGLEGKCSVFKAIVGINDVQTTRGTVKFIVKGDDKVLAESPILRATDKGYEFDIDITGVQNLTLIADPTSDGNGNDHADWALARVKCSGDEVTYEPVVTLDPTSVKAGEQVKVSVTGYEPNQPATVWLHSDPVELGPLPINADGAGEVSVTIPVGTEAGEHKVEVRQASSGITMETHPGAAAPLTVMAASVEPSESSSASASTSASASATASASTTASASPTASSTASTGPTPTSSATASQTGAPTSSPSVVTPAPTAKPTQPGLPGTGSPVSGWVIGLAVLLVIGGVVLLVMRRRRQL